MRREYFLAESLEDVDTAASLLHDQLHINENNIHVIFKDRKGIKQHNLHEGSIIERSDLVRGIKHGALFGMAMAIIGCAVLAFNMPFWDVSELLKQGVLALTLFGSLILGCFIGAFVGLFRVNYKILKFKEYLTIGKYLMLVDSNELEKVRLILDKHPVIDKGESGS